MMQGSRVVSALACFFGLCALSPMRLTKPSPAAQVNISAFVVPSQLLLRIKQFINHSFWNKDMVRVGARGGLVEL